MGYTTKNIAVISEPKIISLSAAPNFVQFKSQPATKTKLEINVQVNIQTSDASIDTRTLLRITEPSGIVHAFHGTTNPAEVTGAVFLVTADRSDTAENLREVLLANRWINANFEIRIPFTWTGNLASNGRVLNIKSKGTGAEFNILITAPNNTANVAYTITPVHATSINDDSISGEDVTAEIELDVYTDADVELGEDDRVINAERLGNLELTMQKTYTGVPLWFELNAAFSQYQRFNLPPDAAGWFDTGTARVFRFIARKKGVNSFTFYQSNALFALSGYAYASEDIDLDAYVYKDAAIKLLSNKPRTPYIKGQREYLNFIFDRRALDNSPDDYSVEVVYRAYSTADKYLGVKYGQPITFANLKTINTCVLDIDAVLAEFPNTGILRVALSRAGALISTDLEYVIRPQALHTLTQFTFLNKLGGWDAFNFDAGVRTEVKTEIETYAKTLTPDFKKGDSLETVYTSSIEDARTVEGAPVTDEVAEWLKELAASRVVLDGEGNYVIKEDFTLTTSATTQNMQIPIIKYRLSETFTND